MIVPWWGFLSSGKWDWGPTGPSCSGAEKLLLPTVCLHSVLSEDLKAWQGLGETQELLPKGGTGRGKTPASDPTWGLGSREKPEDPRVCSSHTPVPGYTGSQIPKDSGRQVGRKEAEGRVGVGET